MAMQVERMDLRGEREYELVTIWIREMREMRKVRN